MRIKFLDKLFGNKEVAEEKVNPIENETSDRVEPSPYQSNSTIHFVMNKPGDPLAEDFDEKAFNHIKKINADIYNSDSYHALIKTHKRLREKKLDENKLHVDHQTDCRDIAIKAELNECKKKLQELVEETIPKLMERIINHKKRCIAVGCSFDVENPEEKKIPIQYKIELIMLLTVLFAFTDSIAVYNILAIVINKQSAIMSVILCVTFATLLDTIPLPLGDAAFEIVTAENWKNRGEAIAKCVLLFSAFVGIIAVITNLRTANIESYIDKGEVQNVIDYSEEVESDIIDNEEITSYSEADYAKAKAIIFMLNCEPILTSIMLLVLTFNRARIKYYNEFAKTLIELNQELEKAKKDSIEYEGMIIVLENPIDLRDFNERKYEALLDQINVEADLLETEFEDVLKEYLGNSSDTTSICEVQSKRIEGYV